MKMLTKLTLMTFVLMALVAAAPMPARANAITTMHTANINVGNQAWSSVGMDFDVNPGPGILVLELGVYDSGQDGIQGGATLSTVIFNAAQTPLVQMDFTAGDSSTLSGSYLFKPLDTPLALAPGRYTIAAYGFHLGDNKEHNSNNGGPGPTFDDGGGLISFYQSVWGKSTDMPPTFPTNTYGPTYPDYFDGPNMRFILIPEPATVLLLGLGSLTLLRKRRG